MKHFFLKYMAGVLLSAIVLSASLHAQEFKLGKYSVQMHGFATQGYVKTTGNNWLTMTTTGNGSPGFTDMGFNMGVEITPTLRISAQGYNRNLGQLGQYHPTLDYAMLDFRPKPWLGFRGGKVKTVLGLFNDRQDADFANTFALLPQSVYPIDLRDTMIAHMGGDIYGRIRLGHNLGSVAYTAYGGDREDGKYSGYRYVLLAHSDILTSYGGPVYGGDFRWNTPLSGLTVGISRLNEDITGIGTKITNGVSAPYKEWSKADWQNQYYAGYTANKWHAESEYRRYLRDQMTRNGTAEDRNDIRGWYVSAGYRVVRWLEVGSYYSDYKDFHWNTTNPASWPWYGPSTFELDKAVTGKFDINRFWSVKAEGHFIYGYGNEPYPAGFYPQQNTTFKDNTNALVLRTSFNF